MSHAEGSPTVHTFRLQKLVRSYGLAAPEQPATERKRHRHMACLWVDPCRFSGRSRHGDAAMYDPVACTSERTEPVCGREWFVVGCGITANTWYASPVR